MKQTSTSYKTLRGELNSWYEIQVIQGENVYGMSELKSITVSPSLTSEEGISIGNAQSADCRITLLEDSSNWPRMARFTIQFRISNQDGSVKSEWINFGTYYTDERSEDGYGNLSIVAFDGMLKMETSWTDKIPSASLPATWPITARAWATMIQTAGLATFSDLTQLDNSVAFIGLNTTSTIRDVLKTIATVHGGNWIITPSETLKLIPFENRTSDFISLGLSLQTFENSPALDAVSGVYLETEAGTSVQYGTTSGYVVKAQCDFADTSGVAELCFSRINQYVYQPFNAGSALLDPVADVGDSVEINGTVYQIMSIEWDLGTYPIANVLAPYDQEVDHEYTIVSPEAKNYRKVMSGVNQKLGDYVAWSEVSTAIEQNAESVVIAASGTYVTQEDYDETIAEIQAQLDGSIQTWSGNVVPTLNNAPAVDWNTPALKSEHVGDTYFINSDAGIPEAGQYYRFENNNGVYSWQLLTDSALSEALAQAAAALAAAESAQDTADDAEGIARLKGRIFVVKPTPPYDVGDLWFNNTESAIKVCMNARASGEYVDTDWVKRDSYADLTELDEWLSQYSETIQNIINQVDQKADTYYQEVDPASSWVHPVGVAIVGIDVAGVPTNIGATHEGDLWYCTIDNTTWYWNGTAWVQQNVPDEVFDKIDGKAQVFVSTPYTPYAVGDLWFNGIDDDIKTCIRDRASGAYVESDWVKYNKYTDDSALEDWVEVTYKADLEVTQRSISAKVQKDQSGTKTSFGWVLNETAHTWYSNNQEVMKVNRSGLTVKGNITATSGFIGSDTSGFEITATAIRNGMNSLTDTAHNGVYIGTNGIALGAGNFKVTSGGAVTAKNLTITGGSINIGDKFKVDSQGNLTASNGTFSGNVYAKNIKYDTQYGTYGTYNGAGITDGTITGGGYSGKGGKIAPYTLGDYNVAKNGSYGAFSTAAFDSNVQGGLYGGTAFSKAIKQSGGEYPSYFQATSIKAERSVTAGEFSVDYGDGSYLTMTGHYHTVTITNGKVQLGTATTKEPDPFELGDVIDSVTLTMSYPEDGVNFYPYYSSSDIIEFKINYAVKDEGGNTLYGDSQLMTVPAAEAVKYGKENAVNDITIWRDSGWITHGGEYCITVNAQATDASGNELYTKSREPISIQSEVNTAQTYGANTVYVTSVNYKSGPRNGAYGSKEMDVTVYLSNGKNFAATFNYPG